MRVFRLPGAWQPRPPDRRDVRAPGALTPGSPAQSFCGYFCVLFCVVPSIPG
jgi:hypothetical protein